MDHSAFDPIKNTYRREFEADCFSIMLSTHLGEDITEGRKAHLADNFRKMDDSLINADEDYLLKMSYRMYLIDTTLLKRNWINT